MLKVATVATIYGIETKLMLPEQEFHLGLQQSLPFTVCAAEYEAAEEQSDDEVRIS